MSSDENILKTRDDPRPIRFVRAEKDPGSYKVSGEEKPSWAKDTFDGKVLRQRIEPWLTALFQSEHLSLLIGSGLTHAAHHIATGQPAAGMGRKTFETCQEELGNAAEVSAQASHRKTPNFEDDLRVANELLRGLEVLRDGRAAKLNDEITETLNAFATSILQSEAGIVGAAEDERLAALNTLVNFLMSFASRSGTRDRLSLFTTNYDRVIEAGAELAGLHLLDRFVGTLTPILRSSRLNLDMHYNPPGIRGEPRYLEGVARFTKLHGSVDWIQVGRDIRRLGVPFGASTIEHYLNAPGLAGANAHQLMIYPNAAKDSETALYPYVELFRDFAAALCRPNSTLVVYGYSFGDEHVNRTIRDMLTIPSTHLVIISRDDSTDRMMDFYAAIGRPPQVSLLIGSELGDLSNLTERYLPKSAIDRTTARMAQLLKDRFGTREAEANPDKPDDEEAE